MKSSVNEVLRLQKVWTDGQTDRWTA